MMNIHPLSATAADDVASPAAPDAPCYQLRFAFLHDASRAFSFPCNAHGLVPMDMLSDRARTNYLYARTVIGRELAWPLVVPSDHN